ncbi:MAG: hypothetical protein QF773_05860, partial [Lentisphaeria bacterium]|nr:hypothetical protein [Lentisphaeria bacterium]
GSRRAARRSIPQSRPPGGQVRVVSMSQLLHVTVGPEHGDFIDTSNLALQGAVERVSSHGGGIVEVLPGTWHMNNALHLS